MYKYLPIIIFFLLSINTEAALTQVNGHTWTSLRSDDDRKLLFVSYSEAFVEGAYWGAKAANDISNINTNSTTPIDSIKSGDQIRYMYKDVLFLRNYSLDDVAIMVTDFYTEKANLNVSIFGAMNYISAKIKGRSNSDLDLIIQRLRRESQNDD